MRLAMDWLPFKGLAYTPSGRQKVRPCRGAEDELRQNLMRLGTRSGEGLRRVFNPAVRIQMGELAP